MIPETQYKHRTDSTEEKIQLLSKAYRHGKIDLAMSLSESIKDTLTFERMIKDPVENCALGLESTGKVSNLPESWSKWASGWEFFKVIALEESVGLDRLQEPIDLPISFEEGHDLQREIRVAKLDENTGQLFETVSQIYDEIYRHGKRHCHLIFLADVLANSRTIYFVFYGNSNAELPNYLSDLQVSGEGIGLRVENRHYAADLSHQMGQLERLTYKRAHGLELFAGGEGHGEPPNIDWAHDYLASNNFQKFRITNWATCPNYEVVKGPVCVYVRRWGFPQSPIHPLFTPSRMHIDVTYKFYAGLPYFIKESTMEVIKDFEINYLRDDEWVFSGYAFTDTVWIDSSGKLHEGEVPSSHQDDLWGVGFFNQQSRDAFIAIWLEHQAENFDALYHSGAPILNYKGHGQLWSRWAAKNSPQLHAGTSLQQKNAYLVSPYFEQSGRKGVQDIRLSLLNPLKVNAKINLENEFSRQIPSKSKGKLVTKTEDTTATKRSVWNALQSVKDEMFYAVDANVVDMGYIYDVSIRGDIIRILMTMPHRGRPKYGFIANPIRDRLLRLDGIREVIVDFTWDPKWSPTRLTAAGRKAMGLSFL